MQRVSIAVALCCALAAPLGAQQQLPPYHQYTDWLLATPGSLTTGLRGFDNPALLTYVHQPDILFLASDEGGRLADFDRWGMFAAVPNFGFGLAHRVFDGGSVTDFRLSAAAGDRDFGAGLAYGWSAGDEEVLDRKSHLRLGVLARPLRHLSVGLVGTKAFGDRAAEGVVDVGLRPLGNELVTVGADYAIGTGQTLAGGSWSVGAVAEPLAGVRLAVRYNDSRAIGIGLEFSLGRAGVQAQTHLDRDGGHLYTTYGLRIGAYDRNVFDAYLSRGSSYLDLDLKGGLPYQRYRLFDSRRTLLELLAQIEAAERDPRVAGVAINTSGFEADRVKLWEVRERLKKLRDSGKRVVAFFDRGGIDLYHFASVADRIVMDPLGMLTLEGYVSGRTFLRGTLAKLGIGYDEWRFFTYKSAYENFSRDSMSAGDRLQRQGLIDDFYAVARGDICSARGIAPAEFDRLVNRETLFPAREALRNGLVDTLGRWETVRDVVTALEGGARERRSPASLRAFNAPPDARWGERPRIAVIYALGVCAMDEGISARSLVKEVEAAIQDDGVAAIVLRVDSPGGDGMASDYIAEALRKGKGRKPLIVSQGSVAASGGYWLSMYADTIVAAPASITGSIGVIGGWLYDRGLKSMLGMSTDHVQVGDHADLGFGFALPFIGLGLPDRNLTADERARVESLIRASYAEFLGKVAAGRKRPADSLESVAQGRVWSGMDGRERGLVDLLGGLETAVAVARAGAGIAPQEEIQIIERPAPGLIDFGMFLPKLFGVQAAPPPDPFIEHLRFRARHNGTPMPMLPLEECDPAWFR